MLKHSKLKTYLFHKYYPPESFWLHLDCLHGSWTWTRLSWYWCLFYLLSFILFCFWLLVLDQADHTQLFSPC